MNKRALIFERKVRGLFSATLNGHAEAPSQVATLFSGVERWLTRNVKGNGEQLNISHKMKKGEKKNKRKS